MINKPEANAEKIKALRRYSQNIKSFDNIGHNIKQLINYDNVEEAGGLKQNAPF